MRLVHSVLTGGGVAKSTPGSRLVAGVAKSTTGSRLVAGVAKSTPGSRLVAGVAKSSISVCVWGGGKVCMPSPTRT